MSVSLLSSYFQATNPQAPLCHLPGWGILSPLSTDSTPWFSRMLNGLPQLMETEQRNTDTFRGQTPNHRVHSLCSAYWDKTVTCRRVMEAASEGWLSSGHSDYELRLCDGSWGPQSQVPALLVAELAQEAALNMSLS